jgi:hypothetical protein
MNVPHPTQPPITALMASQLTDRIDAVLHAEPNRHFGWEVPEGLMHVRGKVYHHWFFCTRTQLMFVNESLGTLESYRARTRYPGQDPVWHELVLAFIVSIQSVGLIYTGQDLVTRVHTFISNRPLDTSAPQRKAGYTVQQ